MHIYKDKHLYGGGKFSPPAQGENGKSHMLFQAEWNCRGTARNSIENFNLISLIRTVSVYLFDPDKWGSTDCKQFPYARIRLQKSVAVLAR